MHYPDSSSNSHFLRNLLAENIVPSYSGYLYFLMHLKDIFIVFSLPEGLDKISLHFIVPNVFSVRCVPDTMLSLYMQLMKSGLLNEN